jgi:glycosyltransferase involved in cell wall biosynthesis
VADFRDPWTQNRYRELYLSSTWPARTLLAVEAAMERLVLRQASAILANTPSNRRNLLARYPWLPPDKVVYLANGWEPFPQDPVPSPADHPLTIVHAGTFYPGFKPYGLLHALAKWRNGGPSAHGDFPAQRLKVLLLGASDAATRQVIADLGLEDIVALRPWVGVAEARRIMRSADILWATLGTGPASRTFVPSKLFDYIAAGRPIMGFFPEGDAADLIRATGTGIVFTNDLPDPVIQVLAQALDSHPRAIDWHRPRPDVIDRYHIDALAGRLAALLQKSRAASSAIHSKR